MQRPQVIAKNSWGPEDVVSPPTGLGQSPGGGSGDEAQKKYENLVFHSKKKFCLPNNAHFTKVY